MTSRKIFGHGALLAAFLAGPFPGAAAEALQPYQLVRSLQLVQDRIASGDHAALPLQAKMLEIIDQRLRAADAADFKEPKNFRALLVYGMSGGNPVTVASAASRAGLDATDQTIAEGVLAYLNGRTTKATDILRPVDPMSLPDDLAAFLALVKGSLLAGEAPPEALSLLDQARLLSPGTLVEEAALRRSVAIAAATGDAARFVLASTQYVERFLYSPYASQFADVFVSGAITLNAAISHDKLVDITSMMDAEREKVVYLRIARRAAIDGLSDLSTFASARAEAGRGGEPAQPDPRAVLYSSLSTVTSVTVDDMRQKLKSIDRSRLSQSDRELLDAVSTVADELVAPPKALPAAAAPAVVAPPAPPPAIDPADAAALPPVEGAMPDPQPAPAVAEVPATAEASSDPTDVLVSQTRRKLDLVDQMLKASPQ